MHRRLAVLMMVAVGLSACAGRDRDIALHDIRSAGPGPDEFSILPGKPLQAPPSYRDLPAPAPGTANLTDQNPLGDGVAALGGRPERLQPQGIPSSDAALVRQASRNGVEPGIRETVAAADEDFRRRKSRFTRIRLVRQDLYNQVYRRDSLNARREWNRYRRAGVPTPTAPPVSR